MALLPAPVVANGSVALSGSAQLVQLAVAPTNRALAIVGVTITTTSTAGILVKIQDADGTPDIGLQATIINTTQPVLQNYEGFHFQPSETINLSLPAGTGNVTYNVVFKPV